MEKAIVYLIYNGTLKDITGEIHPDNDIISKIAISAIQILSKQSSAFIKSKNLMTSLINDVGIDRFLSRMNFVDLPHDIFVELLNQDKVRKYILNEPGSGSMMRHIGARIKESKNDTEIRAVLKLLTSSSLLDEFFEGTDDSDMDDWFVSKYKLFLFQRKFKNNAFLARLMVRIGIYKHVNIINKTNEIYYLDSLSFNQRNIKVPNYIKSLNNIVILRDIKNVILVKKIIQSDIPRQYIIRLLDREDLKRLINICCYYKRFGKIKNVIPSPAFNIWSVAAITLNQRKSIEVLKYYLLNSHNMEKQTLFIVKLLFRLIGAITTKNMTKLTLYYV